MIQISHFKDPVDTTTFDAIVRLYEDVHPIAPFLHQVLAGVSGASMFIATDDHSGLVVGSPTIVGAGVLKTPEAALPIGADIQPVAWVISDMIVMPKLQRQGIGRLLVKQMVAVAARNGGRIVYLYTDDTNEPAKCLYESTGFLRLKNQGDQAIFACVVTDNPETTL